MPEPHLEDLIDAYLAGDLPPEDAARVGVYLDATPERRAVLAGVRMAVRGEAYGQPPDVDAALRAVLDRAASQRRSSSSLPRHAISTQRVWRSPIAVGLAVLGVVTLGVFLSRSKSSAHTTPHVYRTAIGQQSTVRLADGSVLRLAPATSVTVTPTTIDVAGEVYVTASPHTARALVITTQNAAVRVLGTRFGVRQYPNEPTSRVVVNDGRVSLRPLRTSQGSSQAVVLSANTLGQVRDSTVTVVSNVSLDRYTGWTEGQLTFDLLPLRDVIVELSRAYGADIRLADSTLAAERVSMTVSVKTQPLGAVLGLLAPAVEAHYQRTGSVYMIIPGRTTSGIPRLNRPKTPPATETQYGR